MKAVIMAGGRGTRFWPLSREDHPKQFLKIAGKRTLFQEAVYRLMPLLDISDVYVVCGRPYADEVLRQIPELTEEQVIVEPYARNTAPCVGLAATYLSDRYPDEVMAVLPADHIIRDKASFHKALEAAETFARQDWLITFGIQPDYPATGYGYIEQAESIGRSGSLDAFKVARFIEKPDRESAQRFIDNSSFSWNSGMFVWSIAGILSEMERHMPVLSTALKQIAADSGDVEKTASVFEALPGISIDYGVMEKTEKAVVIPCRFGWSDVGSWKALRALSRPGAEGMVSEGLFEAVLSRDCIVSAPPSKLVAMVGVQDLVIVDTDDVLLVCSGEHTEDVKKVVENLKEKGRDEFL